jgi:hypothetical protein
LVRFLKESGVRRVLIGLALVLAVSQPLFSQTPAGFGAAAYARRGIDARPAAMGGAFVAIAEGGARAYYNPAGLAGAGRLAVGGMYSQPFGEGFGIAFQYLSVGGSLGVQSPPTSRYEASAPTPPPSGIGVGITWIGLTISDIPIWEEESAGGTFTAESYLYLASAGIPIPAIGGWSAGASVKYYHEQILEGRGEGLGLDVGVLGAFQVAGVPVAIGINAMDIANTGIRWQGTTGEPVNYVPWVNKLGIAVQLFDKRALVACDFDWAGGRPLREQTLHCGLEVTPVGGLSLRVGWSTDLEWQGKVTAGVGVYLLDQLAVDYAYVGTKVFTNATHLLSARFSF